MRGPLANRAEYWGAAVGVGLGAGVVVELSTPAVRDWTTQRPFATSVVSAGLILALTVLTIDVVLRRRDESEWRRRVGSISDAWLTRANVLVGTLQHYGDLEHAGLYAHYRQAGFSVPFAFGEYEWRDFSWFEPALKEWLAETRLMFPLLIASPTLFEALSKLTFDLETCLGSFEFFRQAGDEDELVSFLHEMHPLADRHLADVVDALGYEFAPAIPREEPTPEPQPPPPTVGDDAASRPSIAHEDDIPF